MRSKLDVLARVLYLYHFDGSRYGRVEATLQIVGKEGLGGLIGAIKYELCAAFPEDNPEVVIYDRLPDISETVEHVMYEMGLIKEIYCPEEENYQRLLKKGAICCICYMEMNETTGRCTLGCKHSFHLKCISTWTNQFGTCCEHYQTPNCPLCRKELGPMEFEWKCPHEVPDEPEEEIPYVRDDPLSGPTEEQQIMWNAMALFEDVGSWKRWRINRSWRKRRQKHLRRWRPKETLGVRVYHVPVDGPRHNPKLFNYESD